MKKYLLLTTAAGAALAIAAPASADNYVTLFGGYSFNDDVASNHVSRSGSFDNYTVSRPTYSTQSHPHYSLTKPFSWTRSHVWYSAVYHITDTSGTFNSSTDVEVSLDNGFVIGAAAGYDLGNGVNFEMELAYRKGDLDAKSTFHFDSAWSGSSWDSSHTYRMWYYTYSSYAPAYGNFITTGSVSFSILNSTYYSSTTANFTYIDDTDDFDVLSATGGDIRAFSIMANVWFDLGANTGNMHPYVGGGVGFARVEIDAGPIISDHDTGFAYQAGIGIGWDMGDNSRINIEYRYFAVNDLEFVQGPNTFDMDYQSSEILVGFRMNY